MSTRSIVLGNGYETIPFISALHEAFESRGFDVELGPDRGLFIRTVDTGGSGRVLQIHAGIDVTSGVHGTYPENYRLVYSKGAVDRPDVSLEEGLSSLAESSRDFAHAFGCADSLSDNRCLIQVERGLTFASIAVGWEGTQREELSRISLSYGVKRGSMKRGREDLALAGLKEALGEPLDITEEVGV